MTTKWKVTLTVIAVILGSAMLIGILSDALLPESTYTATDAPASEPSLAPIQAPVITAFTYKVVEKNATWWKYSWQLTIMNGVDSSVDCRLIIRFLDRDGYVLDTDRDYPKDLPAKAESTIRGYSLVDTELAYQVAHLEARVD